MNENEISKVIVDAAIDVHRTLGGPGLLEAVYEEALASELESRGLFVHRQKAVPLVYKGRRLSSDLRLDLLVNDRVIVECKATVAYNSLFEAQALTYLRLCDLRLALVINFGERQVRQGIHRASRGQRTARVIFSSPCIFASLRPCVFALKSGILPRSSTPIEWHDDRAAANEQSNRPLLPAALRAAADRQIDRPIDGRRSLRRRSSAVEPSPVALKYQGAYGLSDPPGEQLSRVDASLLVATQPLATTPYISSV